MDPSVFFLVQVSWALNIVFLGLEYCFVWLYRLFGPLLSRSSFAVWLSRISFNVLIITLSNQKLLIRNSFGRVIPIHHTGELSKLLCLLTHIGTCDPKFSKISLGFIGPGPNSPLGWSILVSFWQHLGSTV